MKALFFLALLSLSAKAVSMQAGLSLSGNLSAASSRALFDLSQDFSSEFLGLSSFVGTSAMARPDSFSCQFFVWRPVIGRQKLSTNRIECGLNGSWAPKQRFVLNLGLDEILPAEKNSVTPSFLFSGPLAEALARSIYPLRAEADLLEKYHLRFERDAEGKKFFTLGNDGGGDPYLKCFSTERETLCEMHLMESLEKPNPELVSLGENGSDVLRALCAQNDWEPMSGRCAPSFDSVSSVECFYEGLWIPYGRWGLIETDSALRCHFKDGEKDKIVKWSLGTSLVQPFGSRFGAPRIEVSGDAMETLFKALRAYSVAHKDSALSFSDAPIPGMAESVDLRRQANPAEMLSSLTCSRENLKERANAQPSHPEARLRTEAFRCEFVKDSSPLAEKKSP